LKALNMDGYSVEETITNQTGVIGEKIQLGRYGMVEAAQKLERLFFLDRFSYPFPVLFLEESYELFSDFFLIHAYIFLDGLT